KPTVGYFVQQFFGQRRGDDYIFSSLARTSDDDNVRKRIGKSMVRERASGDIIVKLVNLLPLEREVATDIGEITGNDQHASATILSGKADDKEAKPVHTTIDLNNFKLKPYSFTVIRLQEAK